MDYRLTKMVSSMQRFIHNFPQYVENVKEVLSITWIMLKFFITKKMYLNCQDYYYCQGIFFFSDIAEVEKSYIKIRKWGGIFMIYRTIEITKTHLNLLVYKSSTIKVNKNTITIIDNREDEW